MLDTWVDSFFVKNCTHCKAFWSSWLKFSCSSFLRAIFTTAPTSFHLCGIIQKNPSKAIYEHQNQINFIKGEIPLMLMIPIMKFEQRMQSQPKTECLIFAIATTKIIPFHSTTFNKAQISSNKVYCLGSFKLTKATISKNPMLSWAKTLFFQPTLV